MTDNHHAICNVCPWTETWTDRTAAEAASVWHVYEQHPDWWVSLMGNRPPRAKTPPTAYGERVG